MTQNSNQGNICIKSNEPIKNGEISEDFWYKTWLEIWKGDSFTYDSDNNNSISGTNEGQAISNINNDNIIILIPTLVIEPNTSTKKRNKKIKIKNNEGSSENDTPKKLLEIEEIKETGRQFHDEISSLSEQNYIKTNDFQVKQESLDKAKKSTIHPRILYY